MKAIWVSERLCVGMEGLSAEIGRVAEPRWFEDPRESCKRFTRACLPPVVGRLRSLHQGRRSATYKLFKFSGKASGPRELPGEMVEGTRRLVDGMSLSRLGKIELKIGDRGFYGNVASRERTEKIAATQKVVFEGKNPVESEIAN